MLKPTVYVCVVVCVCFAALGAVIAVNGVLDPYAITQWVSIPGINVNKPGLIGRERVYRAFEIRRVQPEAVAIGTSRVAYGIAMDSPGWSGSPRRNLGMSSLTIHEATRVFGLAAATGHLRQAVVGLDLFAFNTHRKPYGDFSEALFSPHVPQSVLLVARYASTASLGDSLQMLEKRNERIVRLFTDDGSFSGEEMLGRWRQIGGSRAFFRTAFRGFVSSEYVDGAPGFDLKDAQADSIADLREMMRAARRNHVDLRLFISPEHAWSIEAVRVSGLWDSLGKWKRAVVAAAAEEGVPLWDFQRINPRTTEPIPAPGNEAAGMSWWWDGSHYSRAFGRDIVDRVLATTPTQDDLAVLLTPANVDESLRTLAQGLDEYERGHPLDVAEWLAIERSCARCPKR